MSELVGYFTGIVAVFFLLVGEFHVVSPFCLLQHRSKSVIAFVQCIVKSFDVKSFDAELFLQSIHSYIEAGTRQRAKNRQPCQIWHGILKRLALSDV